MQQHTQSSDIVLRRMYGKWYPNTNADDAKIQHVFEETAFGGWKRSRGRRVISDDEYEDFLLAASEAGYGWVETIEQHD